MIKAKVEFKDGTVVHVTFKGWGEYGLYCDKYHAKIKEIRADNIRKVAQKK